jgi:hypothetical protein
VISVVQQNCVSYFEPIAAVRFIKGKKDLKYTKSWSLNS